MKDGKDYHFYVKHTKGYTSTVGWDVQKIDLGIAICHFLSVCEGKFLIEDPNIEVDEYTEYIATISIE